MLISVCYYFGFKFRLKVYYIIAQIIHSLYIYIFIRCKILVFYYRSNDLTTVIIKLYMYPKCKYLIKTWRHDLFFIGRDSEQNNCPCTSGGLDLSLEVDIVDTTSTVGEPDSQSFCYAHIVIHTVGFSYLII